MAKKKTSGEGLKDSRTRNWTFILYPESAPENWREMLDDLHIQWIESPLHQFDTDPNGEVKKPHWHVILLFSGVKSYEQVLEVTSPLHGTIPQKCLSLTGNVRYLAHLDNPEKYQYPQSEIIGHGGVDVAALLKPTSAQRYELIREMCEYVKISQITEFQDLMDYAMAEKFDTWFPLLCDSCAVVMGYYIKSQRHRRAL